MALQHALARSTPAGTTGRPIAPAPPRAATIGANPAAALAATDDRPPDEKGSERHEHDLHPVIRVGVLIVDDHLVAFQQARPERRIPKGGRRC